MNKVILISVDGMRPDGFLACKNPYIEQMMKTAYYTLDGRTVMPSVTLPCHMSLITENQLATRVREIHRQKCHRS